MKRFFAVIPAALLVLSLAACGTPTETPPAQDPTPPAVTTPDTPDTPAPAAPQDFGAVTVQNTGAVENAEAFTGFTDACASGTPAAIRITQLTAEGAEILTDLAFDGAQYTTTIDRSADKLTPAEEQKPAPATWKYLTPLSRDYGDGKPAQEWWLSSDAPATPEAADKLDYEGFYLLSLPVAVN